MTDVIREYKIQYAMVQYAADLSQKYIRVNSKDTESFG